MKVSVVIPTWQRAPWVERCLTALEAQTRPADEVIVVGRAEDTAAQEVVARHARLPARWVEVDRPGHVAPVKRGLKEVRGDFVAFLDDDAEPESGWLGAIIAPFSDPRVACVGGRVIVRGLRARVPADAGRVRWYGRHIANVGQREDPQPVDVDGVVECNWAWRTEVLRSLSFDERLDVHDAALYGLDLCLQARRLGYRVVYNSRARVIHHVAQRDPSLDRGNVMQAVHRYSRNYTVIALKHFRGLQRLGFLVWWWGIGERGSYGIVKAIADLTIQGPRIWGLLRASFAGKVAGVQAWRRTNGESPGPGNPSLKTLDRSPAEHQAAARPALKPRVLLVRSHPVPNETGALRLLASRTDLEALVAYCCLPDAARGEDPEYLTKHAFDVPLLDAYFWTYVPNRSPRPRLDRFFGIWNPELVRLIRSHDCVVVYGYAYASLALAIIAAKALRKPLVLGTDVTYLESRNPRRWKTWLKPLFYRVIYRLPEVVIVPSTASFRFLCSMGVSSDRVVITPYVVDHDAVCAAAARSDADEMRHRWVIPTQAPVALFCAKFIARKRPLDVVRAFANADIENSYLVLVGDGPLREELLVECQRLGISERVRFLGLVPYSQLPAVYAAADVLIVASSHEPWGLPVNEAMLCGTSVIASDRVGAVYDLVVEGQTGRVYPCGDIEALARILREVLPDRDGLRRMGEAARRRMETWSPRENVEAFVRAVELAIRRKTGEPRGKRWCRAREKL